MLAANLLVSCLPLPVSSHLSCLLHLAWGLPHVANVDIDVHQFNFLGDGIYSLKGGTGALVLLKHF